MLKLELKKEKEHVDMLVKNLARVEGLVHDLEKMKTLASPKRGELSMRKYNIELKLNNPASVSR